MSQGYKSKKIYFLHSMIIINHPINNVHFLYYNQNFAKIDKNFRLSKYNCMTHTS